MRGDRAPSATPEQRRAAIAAALRAVAAEPLPPARGGPDRVTADEVLAELAALRTEVRRLRDRVGGIERALDPLGG